MASAIAERIVARSRRGSSVRARTSLAIEPVVVCLGPDADFGSEHSIDEAAALIKLFDARLHALADGYQAFAAQWAQHDAAAAIDWNTDFVNLESRYAGAKGVADKAMLKLDPDTAYLAISKAVRQCFPPDGCPLTKGDWADLFTRLNVAQKAVGAPLTPDKPLQGLANVQSNTLADKIFRATSPYDIVGSGLGLQGPKSPEGENLKFWLDALKWIRENQKAVTIGAAVVFGVVVFLPLVSSLMVSAKAAKLAALAAA